MHSVFRGAQIVCELIAKTSISYLATESVEEYDSAAFVAGTVITPALFDILLSQSYYAPHVRLKNSCRHHPRVSNPSPAVLVICDMFFL